ncbi:MAG: hypothetical protein KBB57_15440 [Amaricoccus sp.]|nr:hypothetical protein [Amaricoccus sp.]
MSVLDPRLAKLLAGNPQPAPARALSGEPPPPCPTRAFLIAGRLVRTPREPAEKPADDAEG